MDTPPLSIPAIPADSDSSAREAALPSPGEETGSPPTAGVMGNPMGYAPLQILTEGDEEDDSTSATATATAVGASVNASVFNDDEDDDEEVVGMDKQPGPVGIADVRKQSFSDSCSNKSQSPDMLHPPQTGGKIPTAPTTPRGSNAGTLLSQRKKSFQELVGGGAMLTPTKLSIPIPHPISPAMPRRRASVILDRKERRSSVQYTASVGTNRSHNRRASVRNLNLFLGGIGTPLKAEQNAIRVDAGAQRLHKSLDDQLLEALKTHPGKTSGMATPTVGSAVSNLSLSQCLELLMSDDNLCVPEYTCLECCIMEDCLRAMMVAEDAVCVMYYSPSAISVLAL